MSVCIVARLSREFAQMAKPRNLSRLLENLVRLGIAEAYQLEDKLRALQ